MKISKKVKIFLLNGFKCATDLLNEYLIKIELVCFAFAILLGILAEIFSNKLSGISFLNSLIGFVTGEDFEKLVDSIDRYALIVGGISFFVEKWVKEDTKNKSFMLIIVFSLLLSRIFLVAELKYISLTMTCVNALIISIPFLCIIYNNIVDSHKRDLEIAANEE